MNISGVLFIIIFATLGCEGFFFFSFLRISSRCGSLREVLKIFCSTHGVLSAPQVRLPVLDATAYLLF